MVNIYCHSQNIITTGTVLTQDIYNSISIHIQLYSMNKKYFGALVLQPLQVCICSVGSITLHPFHYLIRGAFLFDLTNSCDIFHLKGSPCGSEVRTTLGTLQCNTQSETHTV